MKTNKSTAADTAAVVVADYYPDVAAALLTSCREALTAAGIACKVYTVPGALEIAPAIARLAKQRVGSSAYRCYVALGCVIRGETYHFEVVSQTSAAGIMQVQLQHGIAVGNGILTVDNQMQARARTEKGAAAAAAAAALAAVDRQ